MAQNIYDDPVFHAGYSEFPCSREKSVHPGRRDTGSVLPDFLLAAAHKPAGRVN